MIYNPQNSVICKALDSDLCRLVRVYCMCINAFTLGTIQSGYLGENIYTVNLLLIIKTVIL